MSSLVITHGKKKNEMREHLADYQQDGAYTPSCSLSTQLAGKIIFPTRCNYLVFNNVFFKLNRCNF